MAPALLLGRFWPRLRAAANADAIAFERYPRVLVEALPLLLVLLLAGGLAISHGMHHYQNAAGSVEWTRLRLADTYLEIPIFLLLVILVGAASPSLGVALVLVFGGLDIAVAATQPQELTPLPGALVGRLVALWALWLLGVEIPLFVRAMAVSWHAVGRSRPVVAALAALTAGVFTWFWTLAVPILVRPMFVWSDIGGVAIAAVRPVQDAGIVFAVFAGVATGALAYLRGTDGLLRGEPATESVRPTSRLLSLAWGLLAAALITVSLGGVVASPYEAAVLFVALATAGPLARFVANRTILGAIVGRAPTVLRFGVAAGASLGVAAVVMGPLYKANVDATIHTPLGQPGVAPEFFSVVFTMSIVFFVVALVTTPASNLNRPPPTLASSTLTLSVLGLAFYGLILATPVIALADNCSGINDCWGTPLAAAAAAGAIPALAAAASKNPPNGDEKQSRDRVRSLQRQKQWAHDHPEPRVDQRTRDNQQRWFDKQIKYWSTNPGIPPGDNKPIDGHAVASSGAGTRG
jgi:hypothetical protein